MANFPTQTGGGVDDGVRLLLNNQQVLTSENYHVDIAFLEQPNQFSITIGSGGTALALMQMFPPRTLFALSIGPVISFMGRTDGFARASATATELSITGRDAMANFVDTDIVHDKTFNKATFDEIVRAALPDGSTLVYDAAAHRAAVTGQPILTTKSVETIIKGNPGSPNSAVQTLNLNAMYYGLPVPYPSYIATPDTVVQKNVTICTGFRADKPIQFKAGENLYGSIKKELDRGGVFLRAGVDPEGIDEYVFLLSAPNGAQPPLYGVVNQRGALKNKNLVNCFQPKLKNITTDRRATYIFYGRNGGGATTRRRVQGSFVDPEMTSYGYTTKKVKVDETVKSNQHAEYLARKECAEARRKDRSFAYSIKGHTLPMLKDPSRLVVVVPDTCIYLKDDEHGMEGVFWIERVSYMGSSEQGRTTEMTLMAPEDLVFGDGDFSRTQKNHKSIMGRKGGAI